MTGKKTTTDRKKFADAQGVCSLQLHHGSSNYCTDVAHYTQEKIHNREEKIDSYSANV